MSYADVNTCMVGGAMPIEADPLDKYHATYPERAYSGGQVATWENRKTAALRYSPSMACIARLGASPHVGYARKGGRQGTRRTPGSASLISSLIAEAYF